MPFPIVGIDGKFGWARNLLTRLRTKAGLWVKLGGQKRGVSPPAQPKTHLFLISTVQHSYPGANPYQHLFSRERRHESSSGHDSTHRDGRDSGGRSHFHHSAQATGRTAARAHWSPVRPPRSQAGRRQKSRTSSGVSPAAPRQLQNSDAFADRPIEL